MALVESMYHSKTEALDGDPLFPSNSGYLYDPEVFAHGQLTPGQDGSTATVGGNGHGQDLNYTIVPKHRIAVMREAEGLKVKVNIALVSLPTEDSSSTEVLWSTSEVEFEVDNLQESLLNAVISYLNDNQLLVEDITSEVNYYPNSLDCEATIDNKRVNIMVTLLETQKNEAFDSVEDTINEIQSIKDDVVGYEELKSEVGADEVAYLDKLISTARERIALEKEWVAKISECFSIQSSSKLNEDMDGEKLVRLSTDIEEIYGIVTKDKCIFNGTDYRSIMVTLDVLAEEDMEEPIDYKSIEHVEKEFTLALLKVLKVSSIEYIRAKIDPADYNAELVDGHDDMYEADIAVDVSDEALKMIIAEILSNKPAQLMLEFDDMYDTAGTSIVAPNYRNQIKGSSGGGLIYGIDPDDEMVGDPNTFKNAAFDPADKYGSISRPMENRSKTMSNLRKRVK